MIVSRETISRIGKINQNVSRETMDLASRISVRQKIKKPKAAQFYPQVMHTLRSVEYQRISGFLNTKMWKT